MRYWISMVFISSHFISGNVDQDSTRTHKRPLVKQVVESSQQPPLFPISKKPLPNLTTQFTPSAQGEIVDYYRPFAVWYACLAPLIAPSTDRAPKLTPNEIRIVRPRQNHHLGCASVNPPSPSTSNATPTHCQNRQTQTVEPQERVCYAFGRTEHRKHLNDYTHIQF